MIESGLESQNDRKKCEDGSRGGSDPLLEYGRGLEDGREP